MCNDYGNNVPPSEYDAAFSKLKMPIRFPHAVPNLEPRDDIWPTEIAPVFRRYEDGVELARIRWSFAPGNPKGGPLINFKSEGRRFGGSRRCLVLRLWLLHVRLLFSRQGPAGFGFVFGPLNRCTGGGITAYYVRRAGCWAKTLLPSIAYLTTASGPLGG